jgi:tungstate transport system substrate-binding protein
MASASAALARIAAQQAPFVSRADDSATHETEQQLWAAAGIDPCSAPGTWYREASASMAGTLHLAARLSAYALADRASWLGLEERGELAVLLEGDPRLRKPHSLLVVNPERHPHVKADLATRFADWLAGEAGQRAIASFAVGGKPVFFPLPPAETRLSPPARP